VDQKSGTDFECPGGVEHSKPAIFSAAFWSTASKATMLVLVLGP